MCGELKSTDDTVLTSQAYCNIHEIIILPIKLNIVSVSNVARLGIGEREMRKIHLYPVQKCLHLTSYLASCGEDKFSNLCKI